MAKNNKRLQDVHFEGCKLIFRNFAGNEDAFNTKGDRKFSIVLSDEDAEAMHSDGWNVKFPKPREDGEQLNATLPVKVKFGDYPPNCIMITSSGKTKLDEESINVLDYANIENVDLIISPYFWDFGGKSGITAYLKAIYVSIQEDAFELKYKDVPYHSDERA